jgi:NADPH-dependent curcumin reductase CurA
VNVGAGVLEAMLPLMTAHGRVLCCGAVASYDTAQDAVLAPGPRGIPLLIVNDALRIEGFLTADFMPEWGDALDQLAGWSQQGQLKTITKVWDGLDAAPAALVACWPGRTSDKSSSVLAPTRRDDEDAASPRSVPSPWHFLRSIHCLSSRRRISGYG